MDNINMLHYDRSDVSESNDVNKTGHLLAFYM